MQPASHSGRHQGWWSGHRHGLRDGIVPRIVRRAIFRALRSGQKVSPLCSYTIHCGRRRQHRTRQSAYVQGGTYPVRVLWAHLSRECCQASARGATSIATSQVQWRSTFVECLTSTPRQVRHAYRRVRRSCHRPLPGVTALPWPRGSRLRHSAGFHHTPVPGTTALPWSRGTRSRYMAGWAARLSPQTYEIFHVISLTFLVVSVHSSFVLVYSPSFYGGCTYQVISEMFTHWPVPCSRRPAPAR